MDRLQALMEVLPEEMDAALIMSPLNRRYYTGFPSSAGALLATRQGCTLIIDSRYFEAAQKKVRTCTVALQEERLMPQILGLLKKHKVKKLGLESAAVTLNDFEDYKKDLSGITLLGDNRLSDAISTQRQVKSAAELELHAKAQALTDKAFSHILGFIEPGKTELEVALELEFYVRANGADGVGFAPIIVSGANSSLPHGVPSGKKIERGDFIILDFGAEIDGYRSDMTRTIAVGQVSDKQRHVYETVLEAQVKAMEAIKTGAICRDVDKVARDIITGRDGGVYKDCFGHGLGHGVGLNIHEPPRFSTSSDAALKAGMVMTVEPGIYLPGEFGVRIEDMVAVTETGFHNFTASKKELIII